MQATLAIPGGIALPCKFSNAAFRSQRISGFFGGSGGEVVREQRRGLQRGFFLARGGGSRMADKDQLAEEEEKQQIEMFKVKKLIQCARFKNRS